MRAPIAGPLRVTQLYGGDQYHEARTTTYSGQTVEVIGHTGLDISCPEGTPVLAAWGGAVHHGFEAGGFGNYLVLTDARGRTALYGHLSAFLVAEGETVVAGQRIGLSGATGNTSGPHVHFEIKPEHPDFFNGYRGCIDPIASFDHSVIPLLDVSRV